MVAIASSVSQLQLTAALALWEMLLNLLLPHLSSLIYFKNDVLTLEI